MSLERIRRAYDVKRFLFALRLQLPSGSGLVSTTLLCLLNFFPFVTLHRSLVSVMDRFQSLRAVASAIIFPSDGKCAWTSCWYPHRYLQRLPVLLDDCRISQSFPQSRFRIYSGGQHMRTNLLPILGGCPELEILAILYLNQDGLHFIRSYLLFDLLSAFSQLLDRTTNIVH